MLSGNGWTCSLEWGSKRRTRVAHSSPAAELVSLAKGLKEAAFPICHLLEQVIRKSVHIEALEDNMRTSQIIMKGRSPALRHLAKTHRVSLAWVSEVGPSKGVTLLHCPTDVQLADSFTKALDRIKHEGALHQLSIS